MSVLLKHAVQTIKKTKVYLLAEATFAFFFSSAFAGIWEIFEFTADRLAGGDMQRGMVDTVTDIIAGNLGALTYFLIFTVLILAGKARIDDRYCSTDALCRKICSKKRDSDENPVFLLKYRLQTFHQMF